MSKGKSKRKKNKKERPAAIKTAADKRTYRVYELPLVIAIVVVPFIVRSFRFENLLVRYQPGEAGDVIGVDYFLHYRGVILGLAAGIALFFLLCLVLLGRKLARPNAVLALPAVYLALALASSLGSEYKDVVFRGAPDLFQPFPVLCSYIILFYYGFFVPAGEKDNKEEADRFILRACSLSLLLLGLIGICQMTGNDPFMWNMFRSVCGLDHAEVLSSSRVYLTLYHPDYVGMVLPILVPLSMAGFVTEEKRGVKCFHAAACIVGVLTLLASQTRAGVLAGAVGILAFGFLLFRKDRESAGKKAAFIILIAIVITVGVLGVDKLSGGSLGRRIFRYQETLEDTTDKITGIRTGQEEIRLVLNGRALSVHFQEEGEDTVSLLSDEDKEVSYRKADKGDRKAVKKLLKKAKVENVSKDTRICAVSEEPFSALRFWQTELTGQGASVRGYVFTDKDSAWFFTRKEGGYLLLNRQGYLTESVISEDALPESLYGFASFRGYAWSKTLAGLKRTVILGTGPDTFSLFFPNNDYGGRHRIGQDGVIYNKPHCWYLQMAAETGLLSALVMVVFLAMYLVGIGRNIKKISDRNRYIRLGAMALAAGLYLLTALVNDSMVVSAPIFWCILGYAGGSAYSP